MIAYIALFSAVLSRLTALAGGATWVIAFYSAFLNIHRSGVLTALAWLVPHETAAVSAQVLCTPYNHAQCHIMQSHIRKVYACLAVTCHLHIWQNDRDLLHATAVTRGWNGYRNKSQHRKSTLEKKIIPPFRRRFKLMTFQSRVRRSNHWAIPTPFELSVTYCHLGAKKNKSISWQFLETYIWRNQLWQWLEEGCHKPVLAVRVSPSENQTFFGDLDTKSSLWWQVACLLPELADTWAAVCFLRCCWNKILKTLPDDNLHWTLLDRGSSGSFDLSRIAWECQT